MTGQPLTQAQDHDRRIGRLEGIVEQLDHRLDSIEKRIDALERAIAELRGEVRNEIATIHRRLDAQFRWIVGIQITTLIAIGSLLLGILIKLP